MKDRQFEKELQEAEVIWFEDHLLGNRSRISFVNYLINGKQKITKKENKK